MQLPARIGKYELLEFLGGGMSHVYRAVDPVIGRTVAVKVLTDEGCRDEEAKARFLAEARAAGKITHDNIISIYDFGEDNQGRPFMVMEFLRGEDLRDAIKRGHTGDLNSKLRIALQVAGGLNYIHARGIVHRDIKPENIHIAETGAVKLMDFGIAKTELLSMTRAGYVLGTPFYMAPEQVTGQKVTQSVDVYAFGLLVFELITGRKPINGETVERVFYSILHEPIDLAPLAEAGAPHELVDLVAHCTEKNPADRFRSFEEIVTRIEALLAEVRPPKAAIAPTGPAAPGRTFQLRKIGIVSGVVGAALFGAALVFGPFWGFIGLVVFASALGVWLVVERFFGGEHRPRMQTLDLAVPDAPPVTKAARTRAKPPTSPVPTPVLAPRPPSEGSTNAEPAVEPGEFTRMFQAGPAPSSPPSAPQPPTSPSAGPAEYLRTPIPRLPVPPSAKPLGSKPALTRAFEAPLSGAPAAPSPEAPSPERAELGEFTHVFQTTPKPNDPFPAAATAACAPAGMPSAERVPEFTQMFRVPGEKGRPGTETAALEVVADVSLIISNCGDIAHIGKVFKLDHFPFRIGRPGGDLSLPFDPAISREHAEVDFTSGGFTIRDLGTSNGTFVNGQRLSPGQPQPLLFGGRILLGSNTELTFVSNELVDLPDLTGWVIGGRYKLLETLFASAKSVMYRAEDIKLPQFVGVKILSPGLSRHPGYREQFEQESKVACRLRHPGICRVLDYGETDLPGASRSLYICMEYLEGHSLGQMIAAGTPFELDRVAWWLEKVADVLDYVHSQGIVHGALKPSAVLFDSHGNPYLADFALAVSAKDKPHHTLIGSPAFLAPEQWENAPSLPATDQYSLAGLTYLMVTGVHAYEGQEHPAVRKRNLMRSPIPAHEMAAQNGRHGVPQSVSRVLQLALSKDPEGRFASTKEFAREFQEAVRNPAARGLPLVFLSYQRKTGSPWTILLRENLERDYGCKLFVDVEQRDTGGPFPKRLEREIERCDVFVCLLASTTLDSDWVRREIEVAHRSEKPMVPVFQESFKFPAEIQNLDPSLQALLQCDGVKFLDEQNLFLAEAIAWLGRVIRTLAPR